MQCENHSEREALAICVSCGKPLCDECDSIAQGKHYCEECIEKIVEEPVTKKEVIKGNRDINGFLWFIFSLMPGAGHMYMGLMKRGVMLLGIFLGVIALNNLFYMWDIGALGSVLVYVYAFFDSLSVKKALEKGEMVVDEGFEQLSLGKINLYYVGIAIIILGILTLIQINLNIFNFLPIVRNIFYGIQRSILPILLIVIGIWLIKRSKKEKKFDE
jgi:TM2 domain-containing membrane protein YozV